MIEIEIVVDYWYCLEFVRQRSFNDTYNVDDFFASSIVKRSIG